LKSLFYTATDDEIIDKEVKRVILIDTFNDEKFEALRVAKSLGDDLFAVGTSISSAPVLDFGRLLRTHCSHSETREFVLSQLQWAKNI
jgi:hypothetical protein